MAEHDRTLTVQEGALVGDEALPEPRKPGEEAEVVREQVDAQVSPTNVQVADKVDVHEVNVALDEVITDPSAPEAVQIPDAGRGDLSLPIHRLQEPTPDEVFAAEADEPEVPEEPAPGDTTDVSSDE